MTIKEVVRWETSDGLTFRLKQEAEVHQRDIGNAAKVNAMLATGRSVAECLQIIHYKCDIPNIFEHVTHETLFSIPHWQGLDDAVYRIKRFDTNGMFFVHGDAGAYDGPYGNYVSISELARYAQNKETVL